MIGFFEYQYLDYKKSHLKNLVNLAKADGQIDKTEVEFLYEIGHKYGLKDRQIKRILEEKENIKSEIPVSHHQKVGQLYDIVGMMMADNIIDKREVAFCEELCEKLKLNSDLIQEMVDIYERGGVQDFEEWEQFLEKSKKYALN